MAYTSALVCKFQNNSSSSLDGNKYLHYSFSKLCNELTPDTISIQLHNGIEF